MSTLLTSEQAIDSLRTNPEVYRTPTALRSLASQVDADSLGRLTVLYSGPIANGVSSSNVIEAMGEAGEDVRIINTSEAAKFLKSDDFYNAVAKAYGIPDFRSLTDGTYRGPATEWLYNPKEGPWADASARFADATRGEVRAIVSNARPDRVFSTVEVSHILANPDVTKVEGIPREVLVARQASHGTQAAFDMIVARAYENVGRLNVAVNYAGTPLRGDTGQLMQDSRAYFVGSAIEGRTPSFTVVTRPLADRMPAPSVYVQAGNRYFEEGLAPRAIEGARGLHTGIATGAGALGTAAMVYDAYTTAEQYVALSAQGNTFGADALLHRYEGRTAGGVLGGFGAGVAYGAAAGSESGPGALITGAVGGVIGAFAGDKIATLVNEHQVNHQTGADGVTYAYENGQWGRTQHRMDPGSTGSANPYGAGSYTATTTPAPSEQLAQLDYQRTTAITALALANPSVQDTQHITLDRTEWHATQDGWAQSVEMPGVPNAYGIPSTIAVDQPADAKTSEALNQIAANRQYNNDHYAEQVSQAYVMDYVGKGWSANGPLPEAVTHALKLPSEQHLADPATGTVWAATGKGAFERSVTTMAYMTPITETVKPNAEENSRLVPQQEAAAQANAAYGQQLIAQHYAQMQAMRAQRQAQQETRDAAREAGHAEPSRAAPPPQPHAPATHAALPAAAPTLSPPLDPPGLRDFRHAAHPLHERYQMFRDALGEQAFHQDRPTLNEAPAVRGYSADQKDRLAAGFTAQVSTDNRYSTEIQNFRKDGDALLAIEHPQELGSRPLILAIPEAQSLARSPEQHAAAWRAHELPAPQAVNTARPDPRSLAPEHPGHPDHAHHRMFEHARAALTDEYARWGMQKGADTLDRETVQVMMGARAQRMDDVLTIRLLKDSPNGRIGEHPKLAVYETPEGPGRQFGPVAIIESPSLQHAPPVAQSAEQFQKVDQKVTEQIQTEQQRQAEINAQGPQGPMLGGPSGPGGHSH